MPWTTWSSTGSRSTSSARCPAIWSAPPARTASTSDVITYDFEVVRPGTASPDYGYLLGRILGAAAAGIEPARRRVAVWLEESLTEPGIKELARRLLALAAHARTAVQLAHDLLPLFPRT
jgi:hypothetical protein